MKKIINPWEGLDGYMCFGDDTGHGVVYPCRDGLFHRLARTCDGGVWFLRV